MKDNMKKPAMTTSLRDGLMSIAHHFANGGVVPGMEDPLLDQGLMTPSGEISPDDAPAMPAPMPPAPAPAPAAPQADPNQLAAVMAAMNNHPDTNPSIYQGISADDRAALQAKLMQDNNSAPNLIAQGAAGIGDAVSNAFGGKNTSFQKDVMANNQKAMDNKLGAVDTQRTQRLQDVQGNQEAMLSDPNSTLSMSMRKTLQSAGLNVPAGMNGKIMLQIAGPLGELAMKQATLAVQQQQANATQANHESERHLQSAKDLQDRGIVRKAWEAVAGDSAETAAMRAELKSTAPVPHGIPDVGQTFNGGKIMKVTKVK